MELNIDCIRAVLLTAEKKCCPPAHLPWTYIMNEEDSSYLKPFSHNEIAYHINQCKMSGFFVGTSCYDAGKCYIINDLSPSGHEFLSGLKDESILTKIKSIGIASLPLLADCVKDWLLAKI